MAEPHNIGWAVTNLQLSRKVRRSGWNGKGMALTLIIPNDTREMAYVNLRTTIGSIVPWTCSQTDLLAVDWELVE